MPGRHDGEIAEPDKDFPLVDPDRPSRRRSRPDREAIGNITI